MARIKQKRKQSSKIGVISISLVVLMLSAVITYKSKELEVQISHYQQQAMDLEAQISKEEARSKELEEYLTYMQTKQYIEEIARDKLGLVYPDEILLKPE